VAFTINIYKHRHRITYRPNYSTDTYNPPMFVLSVSRLYICRVCECHVCSFIVDGGRAAEGGGGRGGGDGGDVGRCYSKLSKTDKTEAGNRCCTSKSMGDRRFCLLRLKQRTTEAVIIHFQHQQLQPPNLGAISEMLREACATVTRRKTRCHVVACKDHQNMTPMTVSPSWH
jgi:hypothetical protein